MRTSYSHFTLINFTFFFGFQFLFLEYFSLNANLYFFDLGGAIRALMMGIHAYFNIWCEARAGWAVFMKRRTAVHKISSLPEANEHQLRTLDDVCAICYQVNDKFYLHNASQLFQCLVNNKCSSTQEMTSAKITRCKHFFHGVCLRKWLYVQDRCPLCHEIIMHQEPGPNEKYFEIEQNDNSAASRNMPLQNSAEVSLTFQTTTKNRVSSLNSQLSIYYCILLLCYYNFTTTFKLIHLKLHRGRCNFKLKN